MKKIPIPSSPGVFAVVDDDDYEMVAPYRMDQSEQGDDVSISEQQQQKETK